MLDTLYLHKTIAAEEEELETNLLHLETLWQMAKEYPASVNRRLSETLASAGG